MPQKHGDVGRRGVLLATAAGALATPAVAQAGAEEASAGFREPSGCHGTSTGLCATPTSMRPGDPAATTTGLGSLVGGDDE